MKILPINNFGLISANKQNSFNKTSMKQDKIYNTTNPTNIVFMSDGMPKNFELNYSLKELQEMTSPDKYTPFTMLKENTESYKNLADSDKEALEHLVKAAAIFNDVQKRLDNIHNKDFENYLNYKIALGNEKARLTKLLYDGMQGIFGSNIAGDDIALAKGITQMPGKGFYPEDLSKEEFHNIIIKMINNGETEEVKKLLNQRTVVVRDGNKLKGIDYTELFKKEFTKAAEELDLAAQKSTNNNFKEFLIYQSKALRENNPELDALADKKWAALQDTPLEFTIGRECYDDRMTPTIFANNQLKSLLEKYDIPVYSKDSLGCRVGIVDKEGTDYLLKIKEYLPYMAENMPFKDKYSQVIKKDSNQTMVDADIVYMSGDFRDYRGKISIASNLPNSDKLAVQTGGGHRNVYHKQMRNSKYEYGMQEKTEALLEKHLHKYFSTDALHDFTILHENIHSLGPKDGLESLGNYKNIIEEHKADMGAFVMLEKLTNKGFYTPKRMKEVVTSEFMAYIMKGPFLSDAHAHRQIMQYNYFIKNGALKVSNEGKIDIDFEKVFKCANEMLSNAIRIQLSKNIDEAKKYVTSYDSWTKELALLAEKLKKIDLRTNSYVVTPLADKILKKPRI